MLSSWFDAVNFVSVSRCWNFEKALVSLRS
jgi:hypothetical protein